MHHKISIDEITKAVCTINQGLTKIMSTKKAIK